MLERRMRVLVIGGAGYIGSHMVVTLSLAGYDVVTLDNLTQGHRASVLYGDFIEGDISDSEMLDCVFKEHDFDVVMHFASYIQVNESVLNPSKYYENNLINTLSLLDAMVRHDVTNFIFSSTAAIFGKPDYTPIDEEHPICPINPYGRSKWFVEQILRDYDRAYGLKSISLRYFNAAGADPEGRIGECHDPETHLIPLVLQVASGRRDHINVYGRDYSTADGTCVRDYIHVMDLCAAHMLAMENLSKNKRSDCYNLGVGKGFSVQDIIDSVRRVTSCDVSVVDEARREGDPPVLIADSTKARLTLGWSPVYTNIDDIVAHAWQWEIKGGRL